MADTTSSMRSATAGSGILPRWVRWVALLLLCGAYIQGGLVKLFDFPGAVAEMEHFGLTPAVPMAVATIVLELGAAALILLGRWRWLGALALAVFTIAATFMANRFWSAPPEARFMLANAFFEHLGLAGAFVLVAWEDLRRH
ncbi:DoxX family protein [Cupriavidus campinensis]